MPMLLRCLNLVMTIPLGFGLNFLITTRIKRMALIALLVGLGFELGQLVLTLYAASPTRGIDITDVLLNGAGVLLGYGLFHLFAWLYVTIIGRWGLETKRLVCFPLRSLPSCSQGWLARIPIINPEIYR
jgi:glycopeptide antibiotics resistance protein